MMLVVRKIKRCSYPLAPQLHMYYTDLVNIHGAIIHEVAIDTDAACIAWLQANAPWNLGTIVAVSQHFRSNLQSLERAMPNHTVNVAPLPPIRCPLQNPPAASDDAMVNTSDHLNVNALAAAVDAEKEGAFMSCNLLLSASPQSIEGYHSASTVDQHLLLTLSEVRRCGRLEI